MVPGPSRTPAAWWRGFRADGTLAVRTRTTGEVETYDASGTHLATVTHTDGLVETYAWAEDGSYTITFLSGQVDVHRADTTLAQRTLPDGDVETYLLEGVRLARVDHTDGAHEVYAWASDSSHTVSFRDSLDVQQQLLSYEPSGALLSTRVDAGDRSYTVTFASGEVEQVRAGTGTLSIPQPAQRRCRGLRSGWRPRGAHRSPERDFRDHRLDVGLGSHGDRA